MLKKFLKRKHTICYMVTEDSAGFYIVKVMNSYKDKSEAYSELAKLLSKDVTEDELLNKFTDKHNN